jgi:hypothetical protein
VDSYALVTLTLRGITSGSVVVRLDSISRGLEGSPRGDEAGEANCTFVSGHAQQIFFLGLASFSLVCGDLDIEEHGVESFLFLTGPKPNSALASPFPSLALSVSPSLSLSTTVPLHIYIYAYVCAKNVSTGPAVPHGDH